jgi:hypothetical protein
MNRAMTRTAVTVGTGVGALALAAAATLGGFVQLPGLTAGEGRPPCGTLPTAEEVASALAAHRDVTAALVEVTGGRVSTIAPCDGDRADRAMVRLTVPDQDARDRAADWLGQHDGYGVPLEVEVD